MNEPVVFVPGATRGRDGQRIDKVLKQGYLYEREKVVHDKSYYRCEIRAECKERIILQKIGEEYIDVTTREPFHLHLRDAAAYPNHDDQWSPKSN